MHTWVDGDQRLSVGPRGSVPRPSRTAVFAAVAAMTLYLLDHNERFLVQPQNPIWQHYGRIAFWLVPHAVAGTCALLLAPLQFSERLRKKYTTTNHAVGRIYVVGARVLPPLGPFGRYYMVRIGGSRSHDLTLGQP